jgi:hypothetical protein|tara:strand:- start:337 stop:867 length:531 start_codon:yes stop_codon:yes gene_type:complete
MTLVFDLETDGLLDRATRIHCIAIYDSETNETTAYNDECPGKGMSSPVVRAVQFLEQANSIVGHNIINFDLPIIRRFYPFFNFTGTVVDTLILSRLYHNKLIDIDKKSRWKHMPPKLYGRHSLESYGYRLGEYKGEFSKATDWKEWSQEMEDYCIQDVRVTTKLCDHFHPYLIGSR